MITITDATTSTPTTPTGLTTPSGPSGQIISTATVADPAYVGDPEIQLNAMASSGLPITYLTTTPNICSVSAFGVVKILAAGQCFLTLSQAGNSSYSPTTKNVTINVVHKLQITLEEFRNVQSTGATAVATAPWPGSDATVKFCVSLTNSKADCTIPAGIQVSDSLPSTVTQDSGSVVTADLTGLDPSTNYYVWAIENVDGQEVTSEIRKLHTPVGPTILYAGKTTYMQSEPLRIQFRATGGAGGFKNWKAVGFPAGVKLTPLTSTFTATGNNLKSGTYIVTVSVSDKLGSTSSITLPVVIQGDSIAGQPGPVQGASTQLVTAESVVVSWDKQSDASKYVVQLGNKVICTTTASSCVVPQLLGPKSPLAVTAVSSNGVKSQPVATVYKSPEAPLDILAVNFALNSSTLNAQSKAKIAAWAKTLQIQGFTSLQVAGHTDSTGSVKINTVLSKARAANTFKYLQQILAKTALSVTLLAEGASSPVESNKTIEGRAANRRAVISII